MPTIALRSATVVRFADNTSQLSEEEEGLDYLFGFNFAFDEASRTVAVRTNVIAVPASAVKDGTPPEPLDSDDAAAEVEIECAFVLGSLDEFEEEPGEVKLHRRLLAHLMGITISTARGVLIGAGRASLLQEAPLPIVAPIRMVDRFLDPEVHTWVEDTPAIPPAEEA